jgi:hypothetical protein
MHLLASFGLLVVMLGFSGGAWYLWERSAEALIPAGRYLVVIGVVCIIAAQALAWFKEKRILSRQNFADGRVWAFGLIAIYFSDWLGRPWGFFASPLIRGELLLGIGVMHLLLKGQWSRFFAALPIASALLLLWSFDVASNDRLLFSDDHTMFMFRLRLLRENFPSIPFWSPLWNAGFDARDFFATGALNAFLLAAPILYAFSVESVYPYVIATLLWVIPPLSVFAAARLLDIPRVGATLAATLALTSGLVWYRWGLKYGTVGFITSTGLFPLVVALAIRHITSTRPSWKLSLALTMCATLMLLWSPAGVAAAPIALVILPALPRLIRSPRHLCTLGLIIALNLPWMSMMWKVSKVGRFLGSPTTSVAQHGAGALHTTPTSPPGEDAKVYRHKAGGVDKKKTLTHWQGNAAALNPLLFIFGVPAVLSLSRLLFPYFAALGTWLLLLGTIGVSLKPQLELDRMIVIAAMLTTIPAGHFLALLFSRSSEGALSRFAAYVAGAFVLVAPFAATSVVLNRADDRYTFANSDVGEMTEIMREHAGGGRVFFTGCVLHELSGGHLAPLPLWTHTEMVASSYAHNIWRYEQPFPQSSLDHGDEGIQEYLDTMNATLVAAHEPHWIEYFRARPTEYSQVWRGERFLLFKRVRYQPTPTLTGGVSSLSFSSNSLTLTPTSETVVLKYRFFPFLTSSGCILSPFSHGSGLELIQLSNCTPGQPVTVRSVAPIQRLMGSKL